METAYDCMLNDTPYRRLVERNVGRGTGIFFIVSLLARTIARRRRRNRWLPSEIQEDEEGGSKRGCGGNGRGTTVSNGEKIDREGLASNGCFCES